MKIVADAHIPYLRGVLEPYARVEYIPGREIGPGDVRDAEALLIRTRTRCDARLLEGSGVRFIGTATIGADHIDAHYCAGRGIGVFSAPGCNARGVLQWVGAALALLCERDGWTPRERTLGVVGVGHVGSLVRQFGQAWGFRVLCSDPPREAAEGLGRAEGFMPLQEIAAQADIMTFHTPLTNEGPYPTRGLGGEEFFEALRPGAAVINSARGGVADEAALKKAVMDKGVAAYLDTWTGEPDIDRELLDMAAVATPHIAGYTVQGKANATAMIVNALAAYFGLPQGDWYPPGIARQDFGDPISWDEMRRTIKNHCDLGTETALLKARADDFESLRNNYDYREEYF